MVATNTSISVKVRNDATNDVRRFGFSVDGSLAELKNTLSDIFHVADLAVRWKDEEDDMVSIINDDDLAYAIQVQLHNESALLRLIMTPEVSSVHHPSNGERRLLSGERELTDDFTWSDGDEEAALHHEEVPIAPGGSEDVLPRGDAVEEWDEEVESKSSFRPMRQRGASLRITQQTANDLEVAARQAMLEGSSLPKESSPSSEKEAEEATNTASWLGSFEELGARVEEAMQYVYSSTSSPMDDAQAATPATASPDVTNQQTSRYKADKEFLGAMVAAGTFVFGGMALAAITLGTSASARHRRNSRN